MGCGYKLEIFILLLIAERKKSATDNLKIKVTSRLGDWYSKIIDVFAKVVHNNSKR